MIITQLPYKSHEAGFSREYLARKFMFSFLWRGHALWIEVSNSGSWKILSLVLGQGFWNWTSIVDYALQLGVFGMAENEKETRSLALTPTWSVALVLTIFVAVSLLVERSIHRLSNVSGKMASSSWYFSYALKWDFLFLFFFYLSHQYYINNQSVTS